MRSRGSARRSSRRPRFSILSTTFTEGRERNIALGVWGAVGGFGAAAGVLLGGILTDALSWEWIFFVNIPVGVVAFALAPVHHLAESRRTREDLRRPRRGARHRQALAARLRSPRPAAKAWLAGQTIAFFATSLALLAAFVGWERGHPEPLMRFGILRKTVRKRGERGRLHHGHRDVLDVPDAHAVHAAGARSTRP